MVTLFLLFLSAGIFQNHETSAGIVFQVLDKETQTPLAGATVYLNELGLGRITDVDGFATFENLPPSTYRFSFSYVGYKAVTRSFVVPASDNLPVKVFMEDRHEDLGEVFVSSTRTTRSIENIPTRVEAITLEEIEEKANMRPSDIRMLLSESTGIQVQQTSAVSGSSNFRIQGLDGRYTQLLKDGFPLYAGFSGGLSIMQIPPLDLRQVEIVKGATSTLYGGGAIAGIINLISKEPEEDREVSFLVNASSNNSRDLSGYYSERFESVGLSLFAAYNQSDGYDPSSQGFSAIPQYERVTLNPRIIWHRNASTRIMLAGQLSFEERLGGDMRYLSREDRSNTYFEAHNTHRISTQLAVDHQFSEKTTLTAKQSLSFFNRSIQVPDYLFEGDQTASFSEVTIHQKAAFGDWIAGLNMWTDNFKEKSAGQVAPRNFHRVILGGFVQKDVLINEQLSLETGLRGDVTHQSTNSTLNTWFLLPRFSALYQFNSSWSMRFGGGMGYKLPDMFTDEAENRAFQNVLPPDMDQVSAEESYGLNYDINFRTIIAGELVLRVNQLFYYTHLKNPLILEGGIDNLFRFNNLEGFIRSRGLETNLALIYDHVKLFLGYTFVDAIQDDGNSSFQVPLNSRHQGGAVLMIEEHDSFRIGFESYFFGPQKLTDATTGRGYTIFGIMGEKTWGNFTVFANFENIFDTRQSRFGPIYTGSREQPAFLDIFAPLDGRYINLGLKVRL